jgi:hypothetical protein
MTTGAKKTTVTTKLSYRSTTIAPVKFATMTCTRTWFARYPLVCISWHSWTVVTRAASSTYRSSTRPAAAAACLVPAVAAAHKRLCKVRAAPKCASVSCAAVALASFSPLYCPWRYCCKGSGQVLSPTMLLCEDTCVCVLYIHHHRHHRYLGYNTKSRYAEINRAFALCYEHEDTE